MERHDGPTVVTMIYVTLLNESVVINRVLCATGRRFPSTSVEALVIRPFA